MSKNIENVLTIETFSRIRCVKQVFTMEHTVNLGFVSHLSTVQSSTWK